MIINVQRIFVLSCNVGCICLFGILLFSFDCIHFFGEKNESFGSCVLIEKVDFCCCFLRKYYLLFFSSALHQTLESWPTVIGSLYFQLAQRFYAIERCATLFAEMHSIRKNKQKKYYYFHFMFV